MDPVSIGIIAVCIVIIIVCLIIIGIYWLASTRRPAWADKLIKLGEKFKEIENSGQLHESDCADLRSLLKAARDAGLPQNVGTRLSGLIDELC